MKMTKLLRHTTLYALLAVSLPASLALAAHGVSIDGQLKYPKGFERFAYTAPEAKSGGTLVLHALGQLWRKSLPDGTPQRLTNSRDVYEYQPSFILGFHGCKKAVGQAIING